MEPMGRIGLPSTIYETAALPLSYIGRRKRLLWLKIDLSCPTTLERDTRIELAPYPWEGHVLPLNQSRKSLDINIVPILTLNIQIFFLLADEF